ncbi:MAG: 4Fe-4S dicluster domain-containing protein [Muribaculaceae bacterium]|jgi:heterodisulfide reductase subunit C|nr:4Fe-4S dicluster domain-containing protein [Muribaculaceae bacterium]
MENKDSISRRLKAATGIDTALCYQCGKCSAGCVLADDMDFPPSYILRLLQTETPDSDRAVLTSNAIWICLNCENCIGRCPKEVDIPSMMDFLRAESRKAGLVSPKAKTVIAFHKSFLEQVRDTGRLYEVGLEMAYKLRTFRIFQDVKLVPSMLAKGKLHFLPEKLSDTSVMKNLFQRISGKEDTK